MRDWTKPLLVVCVVALGAGLFILERRIARLESELTAARSGIAAATSSGGPLGAALSIPGDAQAPVELTYTIPVNPPESQVAQLPQWRHLRRDGVQIVPPPQAVPTPRLQREPSGEINGVPYYVIPLADSKD